jgi:hypothetical protein
MMDLKSADLKALWVFENAKLNRAMWMNDLEFLYFVSSVIQFKKYHPGIPCYLICTSEVYSFLERLDVIYLFDGVDLDILREEDQIDRRAFWACSKLKAMRHVSAPFVMLDNDFFFKEPMLTKQDFEYDVIISHEESGPGYYILSNNPVFKRVGIVDTYPVDYSGSSFNVSFLYIKNDDFRKRYCEKAYDWMTRLSPLGLELHGGHMIFCEQKLLYDIVKDESASCKRLIPDILDCKTQRFLTMSNSQKAIDHLGPTKRFIEGDQSRYIEKKSEVLNTIKDYENIKHIFRSTKILYEGIEKNDGKFYLGDKLNPWVSETPIKHFNNPENKIAVVYTLWEEKRYIPYLKYSLISLIISTDVNKVGDIIIFVTDDIHSTAIKCLGNLVDEKCFVKIEDFKPFKYGAITHPRLDQYDQIVLLDTDAFIMGRNALFTNIKKYFNVEDSKIFMVPCKDNANDIFWSRRENLCKRIDVEDYLNFFYEYANKEKVDSYLKNGKWWVSPMVIYNNRKHFKESNFGKYVLQNIWHRQMCDETVFIMWAIERNYEILPTDVFVHVKDRYTREVHLPIRGYHPIVGENTTSYSNEEMITEIEKNYENFLRGLEKQNNNESNSRKLDGTVLP